MQSSVACISIAGPQLSFCDCIQHPSFRWPVNFANKPLSDLAFCQNIRPGAWIKDQSMWAEQYPWQNIWHGAHLNKHRQMRFSTFFSRIDDRRCNCHLRVIVDLDINCLICQRLQSWIMSGIHKEKMNGQNTLILPEWRALVAMSLVPDWRKRGWEGSGSEQSAFNPYFPLFCGKSYFPLGMFSSIPLLCYNLFIHCSWQKGKEPKNFRPH